MGERIAKTLDRPCPPDSRDRDIDEAQGLLLRMLAESDDPRLIAIVRQSVAILESQRRVRGPTEMS
jgi:hypothetical protein